MDEVDRSDKLIEDVVVQAIERAKRNLPPVLKNEPADCLFCGEQLPDGRRWCDSDCRDEWERLARRIK